MHRTSPTTPYGSTGSGPSKRRSGENFNLSSSDESPPKPTSNRVRPQKSENDERTGNQHRKNEELRPFHAQPLPLGATGGHGSYQGYPQWTTSPPIREAPLNYPYTTIIMFVSAGGDGGGDGSRNGATSRPAMQSQANFPLQLLAPQPRRPGWPRGSPPGSPLGSPYGSPPRSPPGFTQGSPWGLPLGGPWRKVKKQEEEHAHQEELASRWTIPWTAWGWRYSALALLITPSFLYTLHRLFVRNWSMV